MTGDGKAHTDVGYLSTLKGPPHFRLDPIVMLRVNGVELGDAHRNSTWATDLVTIDRGQLPLIFSNMILTKIESFSFDKEMSFMKTVHLSAKQKKYISNFVYFNDSSI